MVRNKKKFSLINKKGNFLIISGLALNFSVDFSRSSGIFQTH